MIVIRNHFIVPVANGEYILVNTLSGAMVVLDEKEYQSFSHWKESVSIEISDPQERPLLKQMQEYRFVVNSPDDEKNLEAETLNISKKIHQQKQESLDSATFVLAYSCNFACPYCYEKGANHRGEKQMTEEMVNSVFQLHDGSLNYIDLYGGEPLLPSNEKIIRYIIHKAPHATYSITTNGYYLEEFYPLVKDLHLAKIMVTLDGQEAIHNKTRVLHNGEGTYSKIISGIMLYLMNRIRVKIRMNVNSQNLDSCLNMKENLISKNHDAYTRGDLIFELQPLFQTGGMERVLIEEKLYFPQMDAPHMRKLHDSDNVMTNSLSPLLNVFSRPKKFTPRYCNCDAESIMRFYDPNGLIYSCILSLGNEKASVGRYFPIIEMKENSMVNRNIETIPECRMCIYKFLCGGGCANVALNQMGSVMRPNCDRIKYEIEILLPKLYSKYKKRKQSDEQNAN